MKLTALVIDDEQSICGTLFFALQPEYEVEYRTDPEQGLVKLRGRASILLTGYAANGLDILRTIKEIGPMRRLSLRPPSAARSSR